MNKWLIPAITTLALLSGCSTVQRGSIPVVDSGTAVSNNDRISANGGFRQTVTTRPNPATTQAVPQDSGVVVMVPGGRRYYVCADQLGAMDTGPDHTWAVELRAD